MIVLGAWLHDIDPVALQLGPLAIRWYGLAYVAGFILAWAALQWMGKKGRLRFERENAWDLIIAAVAGVLIGGRLGYVVFYAPDLLLDFRAGFPWWGVFRINDGGMASHGAMVGLLIAAVWFGKRFKAGALHAMDVLCLVGPFGVLLGRIANFINGELLGRIVAMPGEAAPWWSVRYPQELIERWEETVTTPELRERVLMLASPEMRDSWYMAVHDILWRVQHGDAALKTALEPLLSARHPSQLYQATVEGVLLPLVLWAIWARKPRRDGVILAWFLMVYGIGRVVSELWRLPDMQFAVARPFGLSRGQWLSAIMIAAGAMLLVVVMRRGRNGSAAPGVHPAHGE